MEIAETCELCMEVTLQNGHNLVTLLFFAHQHFDNVDIFDNVKITFIAVCLQ